MPSIVADIRDTTVHMKFLPSWSINSGGKGRKTDNE